MEIDLATEIAVTKALDVSIAHVASKQLDQLTDGLSDQQIARKICKSLRSFEGLQRGLMPRYNKWDALFYSIWYQPCHINLACTLAHRVPKDNNPLRSGGGSLEVFDFGCGALAMQFGLALAAADLRRRQRPRISVISRDSSKPMVRIGRRIWDRFVREIADKKKYPKLGALRQVCDEMEFSHQNSPMATHWLTILHVAYKANAAEVKKELDARVKKEKPDVVLVTARPWSIKSAYSLDKHPAYKKSEETLDCMDLVFERNFKATTEFRRGLYAEKVTSMADDLSPQDMIFLWDYLRRPVAWCTPKFESSSFFYTRC